MNYISKKIDYFAKINLKKDFLGDSPAMYNVALLVTHKTNKRINILYVSSTQQRLTCAYIGNGKLYIAGYSS